MMNEQTLTKTLRYYSVYQADVRSRLLKCQVSWYISSEDGVSPRCGERSEAMRLGKRQRVVWDVITVESSYDSIAVRRDADLDLKEANKLTRMDLAMPRPNPWEAVWTSR